MHAFSFQEVNALAWSFVCFNTGLTIGRFRVHWKKSRRFRWDDYFNALSLLLLYCFIISLQILLPLEARIMSRPNGDPGTATEGLVLDKLGFANFIFLFGTIYAVKASFLALYFQIFGISNRFRIAWALSTVFIIAAFLATILGYLWSCGSPKVLFQSGNCQMSRSRRLILLWLWCVLNVVGDLILIALPCAMLKSMLMRTSQKLGLIAVFSLVLLTIAFTILRTVFATKSQESNPEEHIVFGIMEPQIAVMVCALPCYRGYLSQNLPSSVSSVLCSGKNLFSRSSRSAPTVSSVSELRWIGDENNAVSEIPEVKEHC